MAVERDGKSRRGVGGRLPSLIIDVDDKDENPPRGEEPRPGGPSRRRRGGLRGAVVRVRGAGRRILRGGLVTVGHHRDGLGRRGAPRGSGTLASRAVPPGAPGRQRCCGITGQWRPGRRTRRTRRTRKSGAAAGARGVRDVRRGGGRAVGGARPPDSREPPRAAVSVGGAVRAVRVGPGGLRHDAAGGRPHCELQRPESLRRRRRRRWRKQQQQQPQPQR